MQAEGDLESLEGILPAANKKYPYSSAKGYPNPIAKIL